MNIYKCTYTYMLKTGVHVSLCVYESKKEYVIKNLNLCSSFLENHIFILRKF